MMHCLPLAVFDTTLTVSQSPGLSSRPAAEAACTNRRFGQVGPGMELNQLSQTANSRASMFRMGNCSGMKTSMHLAGSVVSSPR